MKVVFLDIDGVCNNKKFLNQCRLHGVPVDDWIDPEAVKRLNRITDETGAVIVVSSTWRLPFMHRFSDLKALLFKHGITAKVKDMTPNQNRVNGRGGEIQKWLDTWMFTEVTSFVILDDDNDMNDLGKFLVRTSMEDGLQDRHVEEAIRILGKLL